MPESDQPLGRDGRLLSRRHFFIGGALAATSAVAFARQPRPHKPIIKSEVFERWVPERFGRWSVIARSGVVLPPPDELSDRLYDNLVTRVYDAGDAQVMLLLAYNNRQDGILQVHRPEVCYPVGGYVLTETQRVSVPALGRQVPSNVFTATGYDQTEQVLYFTRLGDAYPRSWTEQRVAVIEANLSGRIPDGIMLRASLLGTDRSSAVSMLQGFIGEFADAAVPPLQKLLVV